MSSSMVSLWMKDCSAPKGVTAENIRSASLMGYQLRILDRATLLPTQSGNVFGLVVSLSHSDLEKLYSELSVQSHKPQAVLVHFSNGDALPALCFNLPEPPSEDERNAEYAAKLRDLAERLNFPKIMSKLFNKTPCK